MKFQYKAKKGPQETVEGVIEADHREQAIVRVAALGLTPVDVTEMTASAAKVSGTHKAASRGMSAQGSFRDLVVFTRQMSDLVESSVPMLRSLQIIIRQTANPDFRKILADVHDAVRDGSSLSQALLKYPRQFPSYYSQMVRAGEMGGQLNVIFRRLADTLEKQQDMRQKVQSSLAYPALIFGVGVLTVFVLVAFIIPKIAVMFDDMGQSLPWPTLVLIRISGWLSVFWWVFVLAGGFGIYVLRRWSQTPGGRRAMDEYILKIPAVGAFLKMASSAQFCRTLATLLESGVPLNVALTAAAQTVNNQMYRQQIQDVAQRVTRGESLTDGLRRVAFFPEILINMIAVGEETGQLERSLAKAADTYERQTDETMRTVISLLGPIVLVFVVGIVGCVVLALLLPILQMNLLVQ